MTWYLKRGIVLKFISKNDFDENSKFLINKSILNRFRFEIMSAGHFFAQKDYLIERENLKGVFLILYTISGYGGVSYRGNDFMLHPEHCVLINRDEFHRYFKASPSTSWEFKWVQFFIEEATAYETMLTQKTSVPVYIEAQCITPYFDNIIEALENQNNNNSQICDELKCILHEMHNTDKLDFNGETHVPHDIVEARLYIQNNFDKQLSMEELARSCFMTKCSFIRKFNRYFSVTPYAFLQTTRLENAAKLLRTTPKAINEIALLVGYQDQNNFAKQFKAQYSQSPSAYRHNVIEKT